MHRAKRKRVISSCVPCYTRKQKCDRKYPCNHCSRRRRPEQCAFYPSQPKNDVASSNEIITISTQPTSLAFPPEGTFQQDDTQIDIQWDKHVQAEYPGFPNSDEMASTSAEKPLSSRLAQVFGYCEQSNGNVVALLQKLGLHDNDANGTEDAIIPPDIAESIQSTLEKMPSRPILDFLVRYFVNHVNWMDQLLYPHWFLNQYRKWWSYGKVTSVNDVEFAVLSLKACYYASQFLPSPAYTSETIKGVVLADIRDSCERTVSVLVPICTRFSPRGSFLRVQHLILGGLASLCQGQTELFWEVLGSAVRVAQRLGMHMDSNPVDLPPKMDELEREMRRRTFCNLHLWDSLLSRRLDRTPFLPDGLSPEVMPRLRLHVDPNIGTDAPDVFSERLLRCQLADFWRTRLPEKESEYDPVMTEERYEEFCATFLPSLPPIFALDPDKQWDELIPTIPMQREMLHMDIFEALCYNFGPVLFPAHGQVERLPPYKRVLLISHKRLLAVAALRLLDGVSNLHQLMGESHTRFVGIIVPCFEAAIPLLCLCEDDSFTEDSENLSHQPLAKTDPLNAQMIKASKEECMNSVWGALSRLEDLAEVSKMAEVAARMLAKLVNKIEVSFSPQRPENRLTEKRGVGPASAMGVAFENRSTEKSQNYLDSDCTASFLSNTFAGIVQTDWEDLLQDHIGNSDLGDISFLEIEPRQ